MSCQVKTVKSAIFPIKLYWSRSINWKHSNKVTEIFTSQYSTWVYVTNSIPQHGWKCIFALKELLLHVSFQPDHFTSALRVISCHQRERQRTKKVSFADISLINTSCRPVCALWGFVLSFLLHSDMKANYVFWHTLSRTQGTLVEGWGWIRNVVCQSVTLLRRTCLSHPSIQLLSTGRCH